MFEDNTHYSKSNYDSNNRNIINHSKKARRSKKKKTIKQQYQDILFKC